jgi:polysaccharide lyase family 4-like protein
MKGYIKAARYGSIDALNGPFHIEGPGQFEIVISPNSGSLDTTVLDESQKPCPDATVVLVPERPLRQRQDLYYSGSSDAGGRVHFDSVAPGDYRMFAWEDVAADAWQNSDFIRVYEDRGRRVHIGESSRETIELKLLRQ